MPSFDDPIIVIVVALVLIAVGAGFVSGVQNYVQRDDVRKSTIGGLAGGIAAILWSFITIQVIEAVKRLA